MCICEATDRLISESFYTSIGREVFVDLRFDLDNRELDICYGLLNNSGRIGKDSNWSDGFKINYCPVCGRKLSE